MSECMECLREVLMGIMKSSWFPLLFSPLALQIHKMPLSYTIVIIALHWRNMGKEKSIEEIEKLFKSCSVDEESSRVRCHN